MISELRPGPSRNSITRNCSSFVVMPCAIRVDDPRMLERRGDFALGGFVEPFEAGLQGVGLGLIQNLQADDLLGLAIAGHVEVRHRAGDRFAEDRVPAGDVDFAAIQKRLEELTDAHGGEWVSR